MKLIAIHRPFNSPLYFDPEQIGSFEYIPPIQDKIQENRVGTLILWLKHQSFPWNLEMTLNQYHKFMQFFGNITDIEVDNDKDKLSA